MGIVKRKQHTNIVLVDRIWCDTTEEFYVTDPDDAAGYFDPYKHIMQFKQNLYLNIRRFYRYNGKANGLSDFMRNIANCIAQYSTVKHYQLKADYKRREIAPRTMFGFLLLHTYELDTELQERRLNKVKL